MNKNIKPILDFLEQHTEQGSLLQSDTRQLHFGDVFVALPGFVHDGRQYIDSAIEKGAVAILWDKTKDFTLPDVKIPVLGVEHLAEKLGCLADAFYQQPSLPLWMVGVTGTNGKTTISQWIAQALSHEGLSCGVVGTMGFGFVPKLIPLNNTTPDVVLAHTLIYQLSQQGAQAISMEVSSIGEDQGRVNAVHFDVAIFTNLSRDHLDYHPDMEHYFLCKQKLFLTPHLSHAVINANDPYGRRLIETSLAQNVQVIAYAIDEVDDTLKETEQLKLLQAINVETIAQGMRFEILWAKTQTRVEVAVAAEFNVANWLAVLGALLAKGMDFNLAIKACRELKAPDGRMQMFGGRQNLPLVVVDYAHSPDALEKVLLALRPITALRQGQLMCLFGCGGNRDQGKRRLMGQVVDALADQVLITSDNPRNEEPELIIQDIATGIRQHVASVQPDRAEAIKQVIKQANANDVILVSGKGHEDYQEIAGVRHPFSDAAKVIESLKQRQDQEYMMNLIEAGNILKVPNTSSQYFKRVITDSRMVETLDLFIAIKGDRFDGHQFVVDVLAKGAAGAIVEQQWLAQFDMPANFPKEKLLVVKNTRTALAQLAKAWRSRFSIPIIGVTGSNGKTTVKEMCAAILRRHFKKTENSTHAVLASQGNFNNDIGLPLSLLQLREIHRAAVIEMGMNHPDEIAYLADIAQPTVAIVTNAQRAHLEGLKSVASVAQEKGQIYETLPVGSSAVVNADDAYGDIWLKQIPQGVHKVYFGIHQKSDYSAKCIQNGYSMIMQMHTPEGSFDINLPLLGIHNVVNALAATAACRQIGVELSTIVGSLEQFDSVAGRLRLLSGKHNSILIDDTYNANPDSVRAAIDALVAIPSHKTILVLGDMAEVGEGGAQLHDEIGGYAKSCGVDMLLGYGEMSAVAVHNFGEGGMHYKSLAKLEQDLIKILASDTCVLVKGSRNMQMEKVIQAIKSDSDCAETSQKGVH